MTRARILFQPLRALQIGCRGDRCAAVSLKFERSVHHGSLSWIRAASRCRTTRGLGWVAVNERTRWISQSSRKGRDIKSTENPPKPAPAPPPPAKPRLRDTTKALQQRLSARFSAVNAHENIYTLPNLLTVTRLVAAPAVGYLILHDQHLWAVGLFAYAGITDLVDGWMARRWNLQTVVGSVIDPMADKALMTTVVVCLAVKGALPLWLATLILGRDISLAIAAIYYRYASLPAPKTLARYWDFSLPSAEVHPTAVSKFNTFLQLLLIGATLTLPLLTTNKPVLLAPVGGLSPDLLSNALVGTQFLVAATTLWSGGSYVWRRDVVKLVGADEALKRRQGLAGRAILGACLAVTMALAVRFAVREKSRDIRPHESNV